MTKQSKIILAVLGIVVLALAGGFLGAKMGGGNTGAGGAPAAFNTPGAYIDGIKKRGELRVGIAVAAPMTAVQKDGTLGGPQVLPLQSLAKQLGVKFTPVESTWSNIVAGLQAGKYDAAAYLDSTLARSMSIQFSKPVITYQAVFVVKASSKYRSSAEVLASGQPIAATQGTAYNPPVVALGGKLLELDSMANATAALKADRAVAEIIDLPAAEGILQQNPDLKIVVPDPVIYQSGAGFGLPVDIDPRSLQMINIAIENAQNYGDLSAAYAKVGFREVDKLGDWQKK